MSLPEETILNPVTLTPSAAAAVRDVVASKNLQGYALRLFVSGGGCSGIEYGLALDSNTRAEDTVVETDGIKLLIDEVSINYLQGATVDYVSGPTSSGFKIINPNPISTCGCGQNFTSGETEEEGSPGGCAGCG